MPLLLMVVVRVDVGLPVGEESPALQQSGMPKYYACLKLRLTKRSVMRKSVNQSMQHGWRAGVLQHALHNPQAEHRAAVPCHLDVKGEGDC